MAKSKIISASIAVDIQNLQEVAGAVQGLSSELSNMQVDKNLEPRLKNVERTLAGAVKQINAMTDKIDMLSKIKGIDPKVVHDLSLLSGAIADVKVEVDALSSKFNNFSKGIGDVKDVGIKQVTTAISKEIGDMSENISASIDFATKTIQAGGEKLKKAYEQILDSINAEIDEKSLDISKIFKISDKDDFNDQFEKIKDKLEKDLKSLAEATNNYNNIKISGGGEDELIKAAKAQANALEKLKESFQAFYSMDDLSDHAGEDVTKKMTASMNEVIKSFPNLQGEVYRTFDEIYDFIDAITENITNDFMASINTIKSSLKGISEETKEPTKKASTDAKTKAKSVEKSAASEVNANVSIKEGVGAELIAELKTVINDLQKYANTHPVELDAIINPTWGTKQTQKYLKSIKEQLSKTKDGQIDEKLAARIYGLQDAFGADFSEALNKAIQKLKDSVGKEGFSVGKITIDDSAVKELREQISNEIGAITVDINANILGTTVVDKDKTDAINKQYEELRNSESLDPNKIMDLVKAIKESGANLDYSDAYKDRLKQIVKGLVEGVYGSVPEAIRKTRYPEGVDPLKMEFNGNSARIKELVAKVNGGATGDALIYYKDQIEKLLERQRTILANLSQNVAEETPLQVEESIKDATQQINAATIDVATATINIANAEIPSISTKNESVKEVESAPAAVEEVAQKAEATLGATHEELVKLANARFNELLKADEVDFKGIEKLVADLRKAGINNFNEKYNTTTVGRTINAMLKGGYTSALEAFKSTTSHSVESKIKAQNAQLQHTLHEGFMRLYDKVTVQEKGTGSIRSIQAFVDKVRKSGYDFKVDTKHQDNEIGKLINTVLTEGYKKVADAIKTDNGENKINTIKSAQQNIDTANINIGNATINIKNGKTNVIDKTITATTKAKEETRTPEDKALQRIIDSYNKNINNSNNMSLDKFIKAQSKLLDKIGNIGDNIVEDVRKVTVPIAPKIKAERDFSSNAKKVSEATKSINELLSQTNSIKDRADLFVSGSIYQAPYAHEVSYNLSGENYQEGSARTLLKRGSTTASHVDAYTTEMVHNHPSGEVIPSYADLLNSFRELISKKHLVENERKRGKEDIAFDEFKTSIIACTEGCNNFRKSIFDMSKYLDSDVSTKDIYEERDKIVGADIAASLFSYSTGKNRHGSLLDKVTNGDFGGFTSYDRSIGERLDHTYTLSENDLNALYRLMDLVKENNLVDEVEKHSRDGWHKDYEFIKSFYENNKEAIDSISSDSVPYISSIDKANKLIEKIKAGEHINDGFDDYEDLKKLYSTWKDVLEDEEQEFFDEKIKAFERVVDNYHRGLVSEEDTSIALSQMSEKFSEELGRSLGFVDDSGILEDSAVSDQKAAFQYYIDNINNIISSTTDEALKQNLTSIRDDMQNNISVASSKLTKDNVNEHRVAINDLIRDSENVDEIIQSLNTKAKEISEYLKAIKNINKFIESKNVDPSKLSTEAASQYGIYINRLSQLREQLVDAINNNNYSNIDTSKIGEELASLREGIADSINKTVVNSVDIKGLIRKIDNLQIDEVKTDPQIANRIKQIRRELSEALDNNAEEMLTEKYDELKAEISKLSGTVSKSDRTFFGNFMKEWRHKNFQMLAQFFSFYDIIRYMREAVNVIKQYDSALIEMMKVSDETRSSLEKYQETLFDTADAIGASALTLEQSTADWMRIGESLTEAAKSAKAAQILMNVSEFQDINSATQALVSASQAYAELDKMDIVDKINKLGNEFPIATDQLATALQNSAAALTTQGNDINEALALVVGGNIITQDALKTGTGIRTIALRIAGTKEAKDELAELGEGVDDFVVRTESKTRKLIMDYTAVASNGFKGIDVYNENGNLRSTYEILQDIADIYKEIQLEDRQAGTNRANALVELLAGKNRSNIAASILTNPDTIREAYEAAQNAEGSAVRENEKYLTSVEAHMTQFKNAVDQLINDLVDSGFVNKIIDFGTKFINVLDEIINRVGGVGAAITALAAIIGGREGFFGAFIKNIPILIKGIKQFSSSGFKLTEIMQLLGTTFETASGEAVAFSSALLTTGIGALVVTLGVIISYVSKLANGIKEARKAVRDYAKEVKDLNESLDDYAKKIANARTVLENEYSTTEEIINAKNELNNIQNELNETYGNYNNILKDVNATIEQQNALLIQSALDKNREVIRMAQETSVDTNDLSDLWLFSGLSPSVPWLAQTGVEAYVGNEYDAALKFLNERTRFKSDDFTDHFSNMDEIYKLRRELIEDVFISGPDGGLYINENLDKRDVLKRMQEAERALESMDTSAAKELLDDIKEYETALSEGIEQYSDIMDAIGQDMASTKYADDYNNAMEKYFEHLQKGTDESRQELIDAVDKLWQDAANESDNASKYWINSFFKDYTDNIKDAAFEESWKSMQSGTTYALGNERNSMSTLSTYSGWLKNQGVASDELLRYLQGYGNVTLSDEQKEYANVIREIFTQYGIDYIKGIAQLVEDELLYDTNTIDFNKQLQEERDKAVNSGFISAEEFDKLNISTSKELDIWRGIYKEANNAAEAVKMYGIATSGLGRATGASDILKDMQSQYKPVFDAMAEAYKAIWTNGKFNGTEDVTTAQIESVRSQIESLNSTLREAGAEGFSTEEVDAFILTLADAGAEEEEVQNAFNSMATTLVDSLNPALGQASGETAGLIQKTLTELGVVNAEEVVFSRLGFTLEEYTEAKAAANENELDIDKEVGALTNEELQIIATNDALSTYYKNRILYNSLNLETAEDIRRLGDLCSMLDMTAIGLLKVGEMKSRLSSIEMLRSQGRDAMADFELEKLKKEIAEQAQYKPADVIMNGEQNKSSSTSSGSDSKQKFDWIERAIKKIQRIVTNFGKIADATYKRWGERIDGITGKYSSLQDEIILQQQAADAYMQEAMAVGLSPEYMDKVMNGMMDIETVTNEALKEQISDFQELYLNMQPYLIMVWKIILTAGNPQRQLHYNMTMKYAWV